MAFRVSINRKGLNEIVNETFLRVYYENPLKRSFFMRLNNQDFTCFRQFLHTGFLKMRELNRRFTTFLKKLTRPICITILWIGVFFECFFNILVRRSRLCKRQVETYILLVFHCRKLLVLFYCLQPIRCGVSHVSGQACEQPLFIPLQLHTVSF